MVWLTLSLYEAWSDFLFSLKSWHIYLFWCISKSVIKLLSWHYLVHVLKLHGFIWTLLYLIYMFIWHNIAAWLVSSNLCTITIKSSIVECKHLHLSKTFLLLSLILCLNLSSFLQSLSFYMQQLEYIALAFLKCFIWLFIHLVVLVDRVIILIWSLCLHDFE